MQKVEDLLAATKLGALLKKEEEDKDRSKACWIIGTVVAVLVVAGIACALYKHFTSKNDEAFDDDFEDDFDDDFFEDIEM